MTLTDAIEGLTGTHEEVLAQVRAMTETSPGLMAGADLQAILISKGLMKTVRNAATDPNDTSFFADICIGLEDRFKPDGQIDFSRQDAQNLLGAFAYSTSLSAKLTAANSSPIELYTEVMTAATTSKPAFPDVALRDIIAIREPALAQESTSSERLFFSSFDYFDLVVENDFPEVVAVRVEVQHNGVWKRQAVNGLESVKEAGNYPFTLSQFGLSVSLPAMIRAVAPYNVNMAVI